MHPAGGLCGVLIVTPEATPPHPLFTQKGAFAGFHSGSPHGDGGTLPRFVGSGGREGMGGHSMVLGSVGMQALLWGGSGCWLHHAQPSCFPYQMLLIKKIGEGGGGVKATSGSKVIADHVWHVFLCNRKAYTVFPLHR